MAENSENKKSYQAKSIQVLEGLAAVRKRPAMYIGSTNAKGLHHLVYEVVDNSVDEALAGHASKVNVILHTDGSCSVEDDGRGIPVDIHPTEGISAAEVVMTKLHAGGKFDKDSYKYSGGLHGVGISVVNALSSKLHLEIYREGIKYVQDYSVGVPVTPLVEDGPTKKRGTYIRFWPSSEIFTETTSFSFDILSSRLRELAFLNKGIKITIKDQINNKEHEFYYEGGIVSLVEHINAKKKPLFPHVISFSNEDDKYVLDVALQYNDGYGEQLFSFVNNINTIEGGTHVAGFKSALTKACNKKAQEFNISKGEAFSSEDVREGLVAVINIKVPEPQFEGQTKGKLGNSEVKGIVDSWSFAALNIYFEENPHIAKLILQKAELARRARDAAKKARDLTRRKTVLESVVLPGKLADCSIEDPRKTELFIVEGDSAGGSAKQARDRFTQAILPLRGKILNVEKARLDKMLSNEEIKALISAVGCNITDKEFDATKARYHKIILMTDADVDGSHIRTLLLTFFYRYMQPLVEKGYIYVAKPPLYKAKIGRTEKYLQDERAFRAFIFDWARESTALSIEGKEIDREKWNATLNNLLAYEDKLTEEAQDFKTTNDHAHQLVVFAKNNPYTEEDGIETLEKNLKQWFKKHHVSLAKEELGQDVIEGDMPHPVPKKPTFIFKQGNKEWSIDYNFFLNPELENLIKLYEPLAFAQDHTWNLQVVGKDKNKEDRGVLYLISAIVNLSKSYMSVQRYKGLGEMNPDQLWETAMDPANRKLLQVDIADNLEADSWFATLMGDDVKGRKMFIEDNGQFVKNLDV
jgi:DNA gyrase subunit B